MKAVVRKDERMWVDGNYAKPVPAAGDALVRVIYAGVCDTDVQLAGGYLSFAGVPGHEFVGVVAEGPPGWRGKRVVGEINAACGECDLCRAGFPTHCRSRTVLGIAGRDGVFAEFVALPVANLHAVPDEITDERAVFVEPLAAAVNVIERHHIPATARVAVVGDGKLGLLVAQVVSLTGAEVAVVGHHPRRAERLAKMGRNLPIIPPVEARDGSYDVVVEATGAADGLSHALRYVRPRGTVILKTTIADPYNADLAPQVINEVAVHGNRCGRFAPAMKLLREKLLEPTPLIEEVHALDEVPGLLARGAPGLKHLVKM